MADLNTISTAPAYLLATILGVALWADVRHDLCRLVSGRNVVLCGMGVWYLLEALMLPDALHSYSQEQYNIGLVYVALALTGFLLGYHHTSGCTFLARLGEKITFFDDERWLWRMVVIGAVIGFTPVVYFTGTQFAEMLEGMMGMRVTWGGVLGRGRYGDARAAFLELERFVGGVAPFAAILLVGRRSTLVQRLVCGLVVLWPFIRGYGTGTRTSMTTGFAPVLAILYWKAGLAWRKRMIYGALLCAPLFYGLMAAIGASRSSGTIAWEDRDKALFVGNEMFRELLYIASKVPSEADYQYGYDYYVQLVNPIPRFLWPDKPKLDSGLLLANMHGSIDAQGEAFLTVSPGLLGEMYLNFGVLGIFGLSVFGGWLVKGWDLIPLYFGRSLPAMMYYSAGLAALVILGRSFNMMMFYGLIILALLAALIRYFNPQAVAAAASTSTLSALNEN